LKQDSLNSQATAFEGLGHIHRRFCAKRHKFCAKSHRTRQNFQPTKLGQAATACMMSRRSDLVSGMSIEFYLCDASFHFCNTLFLTTGDFAVEEDGIVARPDSRAGIAHACP
jgi:hypothetical protein